MIGSLIATVVTAVSLSGEWNFTHDVTGATGWSAVRVPHDWAIAGPFDPNGECRTGKLPWKGKGLYRRTFEVAAESWGDAYLEFDGAMCHPRVKLNGTDVGGWDYGYANFRLDVSRALRPGANELEVSLDTTALKSRFYPGAGLYRNVTLKLYAKGEEHLIPDSVFITTPEVSDEKAVVKVAYETTKGRGEKTIEVTNPCLWSVEDPHLYELELFGETFRYGIRKAEFVKGDGFHLNGRRVQLKGVNLHSDLGPLGMAFNASAFRRQIRLMKDMGANALRTSHNTPAKEVLDICDELGFLVWDEAFDKWDETAARPAEKSVEEFAKRNIEQMVKRDRNHPSVIIWSIGNEISAVGDKKRGETVGDGICRDGVSPERCRLFQAAVKALDPTRLVSIGCCFERQVNKGVLDDMESTGWNYCRTYQRWHKRFPDRPVFYSESASAVSGYGEYDFRAPATLIDWNTNAWTVSAYEHCASPWSDVPDAEFNRMEHDRYVAGEFVWTGIDYLGEPTPFNNHGIFTNVPAAKLARSSYFGICDLCGIPKDRYWLYRSYWNPEAKTIEIAPHWNWEGHEGQKLPVYVYTNGDEGELFLNGRSLGRRKKLPRTGYSPDREWNDKKRNGYTDFQSNPYYGICDRYRLRWLDVPYEPGELKVVVWRKGKLLGEKTMATCGKAVAVKLTPEEKALPDDGESVVFVAVDVVDAKGTRDPRAGTDISFRLEGPGEIVAAGNGDAKSCKSFAETSHHPLYNGKCVVIVRRQKGRAGDVKLTASAAGLTPATVVFAEDWTPPKRWRGFNLLGMFRANYAGLKPDPRVDDCFKEEEFKWIADWGFNFVRLPLDYRTLIENDDWSVLRESQMQKLDDAIAFGRKYGIHVQIALHRIPGYCILDTTEAFPLGTSPVAQKAACDMWRAFARRWRSIPNEELSFNLFNEPTRHVRGTNYVKVAKMLIDAIRSEDAGRFIMADGNFCGAYPVPELYGLRHVGQAFRGYTPHIITHFGADWMGLPENESPTWPLSKIGKEWFYELPEATAAKYQPALDAGECCMIGEFGCQSKTRHPAVLGWMEHCLKLWTSKKMGWAIWNLRGHNGILDSGRADVDYEDWHGHKLDRKMLELLQRY